MFKISSPKLEIYISNIISKDFKNSICVRLICFVVMSGHFYTQVFEYRCLKLITNVFYTTVPTPSPSDRLG